MLELRILIFFHCQASRSSSWDWTWVISNKLDKGSVSIGKLLSGCSSWFCAASAAAYSARQLIPSEPSWEPHNQSFLQLSGALLGMVQRSYVTQRRPSPTQEEHHQSPRRKQKNALRVRRGPASRLVPWQVASIFNLIKVYHMCTLDIEIYITYSVKVKLRGLHLSMKQKPPEHSTSWGRSDAVACERRC